MDEQSLFNWGFWDAYHSEDPPQQDAAAYLAGFRCGKEQRSATEFDTGAQRRAFEQYLQMRKETEQESE